ncbi:MAG: cytochrome c biogenesis protein CcsA, partial [Bacteroidota bacterium]
MKELIGRNWGYKLLGIALTGYALVYGQFVEMPYNPIWGQSSRNLFYHVPMWFAMIVIMGISVWHSVGLLRALDPDRDTEGVQPLWLDAKAAEAARVGVLFNILGLITGIVWSRVTWGENMPSSDFSAWWVWDPIQVCALISLLIYGAYFLLRSSFAESDQRARVAAVYNIFAFATLIPLFFVVPKMLPGLHPTAEGEGSFVMKGQVSSMARLVLYPGALGTILLGVW